MIDIERLPPEIVDSARAVVWRWETRDGKPTKPLYQVADPSRHAKSNDPQTWGSFREAVDVVQAGLADGAGYVLGAGTGGVDLDDCRDPQTGAIASWAQEIIDTFASYTEVSPSGTGAKIWVRVDPAAAPKGLSFTRPDGSKIEMFTAVKYFTVTSEHLPSTPRRIEDRTAQFTALYTRLVAARLGATNGNGRRPPPAGVVDLDDAALLEKAKAARNGATFSALWAGDTSQHGGDESAADLALCNLLAFWTGADAGRMDRLFCQSGLMREKWNTRRGADTYGALTISKAIAGCRDTYHPEPRPAVRPRVDGPTRPPAAATTALILTADEPLTEYGAAQRFTRLHGAQVRFDYRRNRWLRWEGHRWLPDADAAVMRLALDFVRTWQRDALDLPDRDKREASMKFAMRLERRDGLNNVLALARVLKPIADAGDDWDRDAYLLTTPSGVIDLHTGAVRPGRAEDGNTLQTAVPYDPAATCPRWEQFISEIFLGHAGLMGFVQRAIGYSLTGDTSEQVLFILYGTGANGKGSLANTLKRVLGDYSWNMPFATIEMKDRTAIPNDLAALVSRRFVIASETNDGARMNEARVKALTGSDPITARFLHGEFFTFEPLAKFWLSVNHKPIVRDDSFGFWRRLRLIPFSQRFDVHPTLADELLAEGPGILTWCVRGALDWQRDGLQAPDIVTAATKEYEQDSDPLADFLAGACELESTAEVGAKDLFEHYARWAHQHGLGDKERLSATGFGRKVAERFRHKKERGRRVYLGLARLSVAGLDQ